MSYFINILGLLLFLTGGLSQLEKLYPYDIARVEEEFFYSAGVNSLNWDPAYHVNDLERICLENYFVEIAEIMPNPQDVGHICYAQLIPENRETLVVTLPRYDRTLEIPKTVLECTCKPVNSPYTQEEFWGVLYKVFYLIEQHEHAGAGDNAGQDNGELVLNNGYYPDVGDNNVGGNNDGGNNDGGNNDGEDDYIPLKYFHLISQGMDNEVQKLIITAFWEFN